MRNTGTCTCDNPKCPNKRPRSYFLVVVEYGRWMGTTRPFPAAEPDCRVENRFLMNDQLIPAPGGDWVGNDSEALPLYTGFGFLFNEHKNASEFISNQDQVGPDYMSIIRAERAKG